MWQVILSDAPSCQLKTLNLQTPESLFIPQGAVSWAPWGGWTAQPCGSAGLSRRGCSHGSELYMDVYVFPRLRFYVAPRATVRGPPEWSYFCHSPLYLHPLDCSQHPCSLLEEAGLIVLASCVSAEAAPCGQLGLGQGLLSVPSTVMAH